MLHVDHIFAVHLQQLVAHTQARTEGRGGFGHFGNEDALIGAAVGHRPEAAGDGDAEAGLR